MVVLCPNRRAVYKHKHAHSLRNQDSAKEEISRGSPDTSVFAEQAPEGFFTSGFSVEETQVTISSITHLTRFQSMVTRELR